MPFSRDHQAAPYTLYDLRSRLEYDPGTLLTPVAYQTGTQAGAQPAEACQVVSPATVRVVEFRLQRVGRQPAIPAPTPQSANEVLLPGSFVETAAPELTADGTNYTYTVFGRYVFGQLSAQWVTQGAAMPKTPADGGQRQTLGPNQLTTGLV